MRRKVTETVARFISSNMMSNLADYSKVYPQHGANVHKVFFETALETFVVVVAAAVYLFLQL